MAGRNLIAIQCTAQKLVYDIIITFNCIIVHVHSIRNQFETAHFPPER